jgi:polyhydroxyalkanoate synthesis regulator phasin
VRRARVYYIERRGDQWCVVDESRTKTLGCHDTREDALAQLRAIEAAKARRSQQGDLVDIGPIEVFRAGTWNGDTYSVDDLDEMVRAFRALPIKPVVKIGHVDEPDAPAYGVVTDLRRRGEVLYATLRVPREVAEAIRNLHYPQVSAEILWDVERDGKKYRRVLQAVALLGAHLPAVDLRPAFEAITLGAGAQPRVYTWRLTMPGHPDVVITLEQMERVCPSCAQKMREHGYSAVKFPWDEEKQSYLFTPELRDALCAKYGPDEGFRTRCMDDPPGDFEPDDAAAFCNWLEQQCKGAGQLAQREEAKVASEIKVSETKTQEPDRAEVKTAQASETPAVYAEVRALREQVARLKAEAEAYASKVKALEEERRRERIAQKVASVIVPRYRPLVERLYQQVTTLDQERAVDELVAALNADVVKLFGERAVAGAQSRTMDRAVAEAEADRRARQYAAEKGVDYARALRAVLDADPALKAAVAGVE